MGVMTLVKFLLGDREAIHQIASDRRWLGVGALWVFVAGLAREYDQEYLVAEPYYLAIPFVASLVASFLLFGLLVFVFQRRVSDVLPFEASYVSFLQVFWATAPLALLYGLPVERWFDEATATRLNLWMLAIVAFWRVLLIVRASALMFGVRQLRMLWPVMLFADIAVFVGINSMPAPMSLVATMGGARLPAAVQIVSASTFLVGFFTILSFPIWLIGTLSVAKMKVTPKNGMLLSCPIDARRHRGLWVPPALIMLVWMAILFVTQPQQGRAYSIDQQLRRGEIAEALGALSKFEREQFPVGYDPAPRILYRENTPPIDDVVSVMFEIDTAAWVHDLYARKYLLHLQTGRVERIDELRTALRLILLSVSQDQLACEFLRGRMRFNPKVLDDPEYDALDAEIRALCEEGD